MCDKLYSKRSAFNYLEDLAQEFHKNYGRKVNTVTRPYAFIEFDVYIQKAKKNLTDRRRNINSINNQLQDVQRIMVRKSTLMRAISFKRSWNFTVASSWITNSLFFKNEVPTPSDESGPDKTTWLFIGGDFPNFIFTLFVGTKHWRCTTTRHRSLRIRHKNTKSIDVVAKIQERRHLFKSQIDVCESGCRCNRFHCVYFVFLDSLKTMYDTTPSLKGAAATFTFMFHRLWYIYKKNSNFSSTKKKITCSTCPHLAKSHYFM